MNDKNTDTIIQPRIVGFVCNWDAYSGVEMAGINNREYPASIALVRVSCLGRLHLGFILKVFELGADGVMLIGCPQGDCYYDSGMTRAKELYEQAGKMLRLLGIDKNRLLLLEVPLGNGDFFTEQVSAFARRIDRARSRPSRLNTVKVSLT